MTTVLFLFFLFLLACLFQECLHFKIRKIIFIFTAIFVFYHFFFFAYFYLNICYSKYQWPLLRFELTTSPFFLKISLWTFLVLFFLNFSLPAWDSFGFLFSWWLLCYGENDSASNQQMNSHLRDLLLSVQ